MYQFKVELKRSKGQALIPLLILIVILLSLGATAIELAIGNILIDRYSQEELIGYYTTESALENGLLRVLRNPNYAGEDLQINGASCTIEVSGTTEKTILAFCEDENWIRRIQAQISFVDGQMEINSFQEIE